MVYNYLRNFVNYFHQLTHIYLFTLSFVLSYAAQKSVFFILNKSNLMHNIPFIPGGIDNLSRDSRSSRVTYQYYIFPDKFPIIYQPIRISQRVFRYEDVCRVVCIPPIDTSRICLSAHKTIA